VLRAAILAFAIGLLAVLTPVGWASLHHPEEPFAIPMNEKGQPDLPFRTFTSRRADLINAFNPASPLDDPIKGGRTIRGRTKDRIERLQKLPNRTELQSVELAIDLLRFGRVNEAEEPLRNFRRGYIPNMTLAHIAAVQGEWSRAYTFLDIATEERPPMEFPGLTAQQLAWQLKVNKGPLKKLFQLRLAESRGPKRPVEDELPDRIFDVNFVNAAGQYEPGTLASAEQAKLPPDAIPIVQQLVLWFPLDPRLYWLLAELYAAKGEVGFAKEIMDQCVGSMSYSNRKVLMQHREAVTQAAKAKGPAPDEPLLSAQATPAPGATQEETPTPPPPAVPISLSTVWIYFGVVAAVALFALVRAILRSRKAGSGPAM
jgi:hypothetical protein